MAPEAFRCSADTTHAADHGHSSVCRTGSTLGSPHHASRATMPAVATAGGGGTSQPRSGEGARPAIQHPTGDDATGQMLPTPPSLVTTGRPASAQASIPPSTLTGSNPLRASSWATFAERPPALQMTYNVADRSISASRAAT